LALQLLKLASAENAGLAQMAGLIRSDPAITTEVLRLANSPLFGARCEITSIVNALGMLGLTRIRSLVMVIAVRDLMSPARHTEAFPHCWRHCLATAFIAEMLSHHGALDPDTCYTGGLIHDAGQLALIAAHPTAYDELVAGARQCAGDVLSLEQASFGTHHHQVGLMLLERWGLAGTFREVLAHFDPQLTPSGIGALVRTASRMSEAIGFHVAPAGRQWKFPAYPAIDPEKLTASVATKINTLECSLLMV
jgi:HD-like signal output (HDOD) protein